MKIQFIYNFLSLHRFYRIPFICSRTLPKPRPYLLSISDSRHIIYYVPINTLLYVRNLYCSRVCDQCELWSTDLFLLHWNLRIPLLCRYTRYIYAIYYVGKHKTVYSSRERSDISMSTTQRHVKSGTYLMPLTRFSTVLTRF